MKIPLVDLNRQHRSLKDEIELAINAVFSRGDFIQGEDVTQFEIEYARFCGAEHAIAVSNGTDALILALRALDIGPGDEVITVPFTFAATVEAILTVGAKPRFIDVGKETRVMDPSLLESAFTPQTRAIIPVHLFGFPCNMEPILAFARPRHLWVIEDGAQAQGASVGPNRVGAMGDIACFSFYPGKNLGACGEAGAVVTQKPQLAQKIRLMRNHGSSDKYHHVLLGWNNRMDTLQAAILRVKLRHLDAWNGQRRRVAERYTDLLKKVTAIDLPQPCPYGREVFHFYVVRVPDRDGVREFLNSKGISTGVHYPIPLHLQQAFRCLDYGVGDFPVSESAAQEVLSLPTFPEMEDREIEFVAEALSEAVELNVKGKAGTDSRRSANA